MGVVNPPQVMPVVMRAVCRYFAYRGPGHEVMRRELEGILEPPDATQPGETRPRPVEATITEALALGLLETEGDGEEASLRCARDLPEAPLDSLAFEQQLADVLRGVILEERNSSALFARPAESSETRESSSEGTPQALDTTQGREFARISAWLLLQDPAGPGLAYNVGGGHADEDVEARQRGQCTFALVINDLRWNSFRRWARYLGLARSGLHGRLIGDPTAAVAEELQRVFDGLAELPIDAFAERLAALLPVIDGGRCQAEVLEHAIMSDPRAANAGDRPVSAALAFALLRLERRGSLRLDDRADAPSHRDVAGRVVTHISRDLS